MRVCNVKASSLGFSGCSGEAEVGAVGEATLGSFLVCLTGCQTWEATNTDSHVRGLQLLSPPVWLLHKHLRTDLHKIWETGSSDDASCVPVRNGLLSLKD